MCDETPQERQDNEIEALKSIFGEQLQDNRQAIAWKVWRPLDLMLSLHPLHSSSVAGIHCSVTLHIQCCPNYPDKPPKITIHKLHGVSNENGVKLLTELESLANKLCGEVMIFELAQHAQNFLHAFNKPTLSFYDEMLERRNEAEKLKQQNIQIKENAEREKIKTEIQRRQEILKGAGKQRVPRLSTSQESNEGQGDAPELMFYADNKTPAAKKVNKDKRLEVPCNCVSKGIQILRLTQKNNKKIHIGKCLTHSQNGSTSYIAIDAETGDSLIARKYPLNPATDLQMRNKQMTSIEQDLKSMCRLRNANLIPYFALEIQQEVTKRTTVQCVYIFREFVLGTSLKLLKTVSKFSDDYEVLSLLRHVGLGVFSALKELHSAGVVHRDVTSSNVFLDCSGGVKLVGASLDVRLAEILDADDSCDRHSKSHDILAAAQVLLSILSTNADGREVPSQLPASAKDFFSRCLTEDEVSRWSAEQLLNHGFLQDTPGHSSKQGDDGYRSAEGVDEDIAKSLVTECMPSSGHSRLSAEFEILKWLGKGAFGDVLKVKNKLDGGFYALKRIKLNPENVQLNKKITREVKLLSRLNHENVVRYYNAWIETMEGPVADVSGASKSPTDTPVKKTFETSMDAVVAKLAPGVKLEWSISEIPVRKRNDISESESDDDDEDDGWFKMLPVTTDLDGDTSSSIEFEVDTANQSETLPSELTNDTSRPATILIQQVLYIQMEFCEKNTLRHAIDNRLYLDNVRIWRLFREIVNGLNHVHQRGMIHRDLKPVNIFLDSNDHVKIGDFGLATKAFVAPVSFVDEKNKPLEEIGGSLTGQIGTALYVAPELLQGGNKVIYNQKVDIYSLGIILFEMFHPPLDTGMERMKVLTELRSKEIVMPTKFVIEKNAKQIHVIRWLLNHEPSIRPTCAELLSSEHVPRPVPEATLSALLSHTINDRSSRTYQRLVSACLDQRMSAAEDYTYHSGCRSKPDAELGMVKDVVIRVFKQHGGVEFTPPLLLPRVKTWDQYPNAVKLMTAFGSVCHLPHDLRLPFARHVAFNETRPMRRYTADRVYREKHVDGFHPREILECAFDIVTHRNSSLWSDAELLLVASKAASEANLKVCIALNHSDILKILLLCCGVPVDRHADLYPILVDVRLGRITSLQLQTHLTSLCITNRDISNLLRFMETEVCITEIRDVISSLAKKAEWSRTINRAISDIETVITNVKAFGFDCPVTVAPCLAYNATQHNGVFWQMSVQRESRRNKHRSADLIAVGGRYDALVEEFWQIARTEKERGVELKSSCVGFSMSLERMAAIVRKMDDDTTSAAGKLGEPPKITVCVHGAIDDSRVGQQASRRARLAGQLWASGLGASVSECGAANDAREHTGADIVLMDDDGYVRAVCWADNRVREQRIPFIDVLDFVKLKLNPELARSPDGYNRTTSWCETEKTNSPNISVSFITDSEKMSKNSRRQCENQISAQVTLSLQKLGVYSSLGRVRVCVIAMCCECECVRALAAHIDAPYSSMDSLPSTLLYGFPRRKKMLEEAITELQSIASLPINQSRSPEEPVLFALYSIPDSYCKIIT